MTNNKIIPALAAGFAASVLSTVPGLKNASCCLFIPLAAVFSIFLYNKINNITERIKPGQAVLFGMLTGLFGALFATFFEVAITFITKTNEFIEMLPQTEAAMQELNLGPLLDQSLELMHHMAKEIRTTGFSAMYAIGMFFSNMIMYTIFGMLGGLLATVVLNRKNTPKL